MSHMAHGKQTESKSTGFGIETKQKSEAKLVNFASNENYCSSHSCVFWISLKNSSDYCNSIVPTTRKLKIERRETTKPQEKRVECTKAHTVNL